MLSTVKSWATTVIGHQAFRDGLRCTWCRFLANTVRYLLLRSAAMHELRRAGLVLYPGRTGTTLAAVMLSPLISTDTIFIGSIIDAFVIRGWMQPALVMWFKPPTLREVEAEDLDASDDPASPSPPPLRRRSAAAVAPPAAAAAGHPNENSDVGYESPAPAILASINSPDAVLPKSKFHATVKRLTYTAEVVIHSIVTATLAEAIRRQSSLPFKAFTWVGLFAMFVQVELRTRNPTSVVRRDAELTDLGKVVLNRLQRCPRGSMDAFDSFRFMRNQLGGGPVMLAYAALYPAVMEGAITILCAMLSGSTVAAKLIPCIRRRVFRPLYRRFPYLKPLTRHIEGATAALGPVIMNAVLSAPLTALKYRIIMSTILGVPYPTLGAAVSTMARERGIVKCLAATAFANFVLSAIQVIDVPKLVAEAVYWVQRRRSAKNR
jgi:hypothetical protein